MSIINLTDLPSIRQKHKGQKIVFCSGSFDLLHAGHILFFEDCKTHGEILVVMVGNDYNQTIYKGPDRPILNEHVRLKTVDSLKPVDYALLDLNAVDGDVLKINERVFAELKPDFYVVNEDAFNIPRRKQMVEGTSAKMIIHKRTCPPEFDKISTTKILNKIKSLKNPSSA